LKKIILAVAVAALAVMAVASSASADVARCEAPVTGTTTVKLTAVEPADRENVWAPDGNEWTHTYTLTVEPNGSFSGEGVQNGHNIWGATMVNVPVTITDGQFIDSNNDGVADHVSYTATRPSDGNVWHVANAALDGTSETVATQDGTDATVKFKVSAGAVTLSESVKNHGQYVKSQGGGKEAAQACAGMPLNSTQGGKVK
jgi:hypothetical protein